MPERGMHAGCPWPLCGGGGHAGRERSAKGHRWSCRRRPAPGLALSRAGEGRRPGHGDADVPAQPRAGRVCERPRRLRGRGGLRGARGRRARSAGADASGSGVLESVRSGVRGRRTAGRTPGSGRSARRRRRTGVHPGTVEARSGNQREPRVVWGLPVGDYVVCHHGSPPVSPRGTA